jgi:DNA-binding NarL/FixJ family response regulator
LIAVFIAVDLVADSFEGAGLTHLAVEALLFAIAVCGVVLLVGRLRAARQRGARLRNELAAAREEAQKWRRESSDILRGLGEAITGQFARWKLTPAEAEVGLLLLKGFSFHEIADLRGTSERTVRGQARSLYRKAGLSSRAALSAYFLEDLLLAPELGEKRES